MSRGRTFHASYTSRWSVALYLVLALLLPTSSSAICLLAPPFCAHKETKKQPSKVFFGVARHVSPLQRHTQGNASWETIRFVLATDTDNDGIFGGSNDRKISVEVIDTMIRGQINEESEYRIDGAFSKKREGILIAKKITSISTGASFVVNPFKHPFG